MNSLIWSSDTVGARSSLYILNSWKSENKERYTFNINAAKLIRQKSNNHKHFFIKE